VRGIVDENKLTRTCETIRKINRAELMRFKIGLDGLSRRALRSGDCAIGILLDAEKDSLLSPDGFFRGQLEAAQKSGAKIGLICFGEPGIGNRKSEIESVFVPVPQTDLLLDGLTRVAVKLVMNAISTCTMVRLGRVMVNFMIWVAPGNLKLIDRATRYISMLAGLPYKRANELLFEVIEYIKPRMKSDQAYPSVVGMAVIRARDNLSNAGAEKKLLAEL
jgi:N-acetylmuramic acid 6-phosphate (MurNAc-6-P) etherase